MDVQPAQAPVQVNDRTSAVRQDRSSVQRGAGHECAELLRDQIAMLESTLEPGGAWDRRIAEAEQTIAQLRIDRSNSLRALAALREALEEVAHAEHRTTDPCGETLQSNMVKGDRLAHARGSSRAA